MKQFILLLVAGLLLIPALAAQNTAVQKHPSLDDELKILSWNIYMLPFVIFKKSGKKERAEGIGETLAAKDYDIILFQEAFKKNIRRVLRNKLHEEYPYHYGPANQKKLSFRTSSGLYVFSRKPLIHKEEVQFDACSGHDCMARKGAMLLEGEFKGKIFQVVTTHTNGGHAINNSQFHTIYDGLLHPFYEEGVPQIIAGDMNCRRDREPHYSEMLQLLDAEDGPTEGFPYSNWEQSGVIDYILLRNNQSGIQVKKREILAIGGETNLEVQRPQRESIGLSDHYALEIILTW